MSTEPAVADPPWSVRRFPWLTSQPPIVTVFLVMLGGIPLVPRPTIGGYWPIAVAAFMMGITGLGIVAMVQAPRHAVWPSLLVGLGVAAVSIQIVSLLIRPGDGGELLTSRILMWGVIMVTIGVGMAYRLEVPYMVQPFLVGLIVVAGISLFIGITGVALLEPARPPRPLGFNVPLYKTAGVPRSFGEVGVLVAIGGSALAAYWAAFPKWLRVVSAGSLFLFATMSQSRSVYLVVISLALVFVISYLKRASSFVVAASFLAVVLLPVMLSVAFPLISRSPLVSSFVGEGVFETNVEDRFALNAAAIEALREAGLMSWAVGADQDIWDNAVVADANQNTVHNSFLSNLQLLGLPVAAITISAWFGLPISSSIRRGANSGDGRFVWLVLVGAIAGLQFYPGLFSPGLAFAIGLVWIVRMRSDGVSARIAVT